MFFSRSKHVYPGTGASEFLTEEDQKSGRFDALYQMQGFRQKMSNFHPVQKGFLCRGKRWRTVEHCFQGIKCALVDPDYAATFSMDSESPLSQDDANAARRAGSRRACPLSPDILKEWDRIKWGVMEEALNGKYNQNEELKQILLATLDAELVHRPPRSKLVVEEGLMRVRERIRQEERENKP